ncbi:5649_t:CDS:2 [Diversispora eburnea]|uniref:5649_t:CDS:1 n=1 Tax=Diversispora eburnea TaxID=1213867 RepID=A0A9N8WRA4_9GLOM|nr:5649_t:CDS:2 [Diversispora eburnea]
MANLLPLIVSCWTHYDKIVKNEHWGYPEEWFPSVSASIGDWYPARSIFQIFIACTSGPRFIMIFLFYLITNKPENLYPKIHAIIGIIRTLSVGGWVYITSTDDHFIHDVAMILYLVTTLPWMLGSISISPDNNMTLKWRKRVMFIFFGSLVPMIYYFVQHKVHHVAGAFVYWSTLTSLALTIWYFPLWSMGISGYEAFLLVTCSPFLLGIKKIRETVSSFPGIFHLLSLLGVASYMFVDPVPRLITISFGIATSNLLWTSIWLKSRNNQIQLERISLIWGLGLIMSNVIKMAWWTNNPIWPIMHKENGGRNEVGLLLGIISSLIIILLNLYNSPNLPNSPNSPKSSESSNSPNLLNDRFNKKATGSWVSAAVGLGSLMFALHSLLTDTTIISRWVYSGYPNTGPQPILSGILIITTMSLGLIISTYRKIVISFPWYVIGCVSCACLYYYPTWKGYFGGLLLSIYLMSLIPTFIRNVVQYPPGKTLFTTMMTYNIFCLAHVWVVAYAFVPAGEYMREHTDYVLFTMMALIGLMILMTLSVTYSRYPTELPISYHPEQKLITAGIWTIHFALDNDMWASEFRMRDLIKDLEIDVIDLGRIIMGNRDFTQFLAEDLKMYSDYGPGPSKHTWGCAMLSKFPIINSTHHLLPSPVGELACAIHATLDVYGKEVDVIVSHNGQEEDEEDRKLQTTELAKIMRSSNNPIIFLGIKKVGYARVSHENDVDPQLRFPSKFHGEGIRGHKYHVFNEPRYYSDSNN